MNSGEGVHGTLCELAGHTLQAVEEICEGVCLVFEALRQGLLLRRKLCVARGSGLGLIAH